MKIIPCTQELISSQLLRTSVAKTKGDIFNDLQMLNHLTESDSTRVGTDRDSEFCGHEVHGQDFVHASHASRIDLM